MKLTLIFLAGCISASLTYGPAPFDWQHLSEKPNNPYMALIDLSDEDISDNDNWNSNDDTMWRNRQPLRQYHHNENVNQFYYPMAPSFMPTPVKDRDSYRISSRQKNRNRPYLRPVPATDLINNNNGRFLASFPNLFFPSAFYSYLSSFSTSAFSTTTTYLILNSTLTTTIMTSCIPILSFSASSLANIGCRRKRDLINEAVVTGDDEFIHDPDYLPTEELRWVDSFLVDSQGRQINPEILSSMETELSSNHLPDYVRRARSARYTITSTFTSYSFYTVNSTKTAIIGSSLFCMPNGFKTC